MWKLGLSIHSFGEEVFGKLAEGNVDCIEVSVGDKNLPVPWENIGAFSREYGIELWSYHLPFYPFEEIDLAAKDTGKRAYTVYLLSELMKKAGELGIKYAIVHPSAEPISENEREMLLEYSGEALAKLAEAARQCGMTLAVEDLPRTCLGNCISDIKKLISYSDDLRVCLDTNHLFTETNADFIKALGDKIMTLHVSDYDFLNERHWLPYEGKSDWIGMVTALEEAGYAGPWLYEVGFKAPPTIERPPLTVADFRENYLACIYKQPAAPVGKPVESECKKRAYFDVPRISG